MNGVAGRALMELTNIDYYSRLNRKKTREINLTVHTEHGTWKTKRKTKKETKTDVQEKKEKRHDV